MNYVDNRINVNLTKKGYGWKVYIKLDKKLYPVYFQVSTSIRKNKYITSTHNTMITIYGTQKYRSGFHIYHTRKDARKLARALRRDYERAVVKKVKYKDVLHTGYDYGRCIIAKKIMVVDR